jgi:CRISPR-associated protein Cas2
MNGSIFVISYDVSDNKRRRLLARALEGAGRRVQESVFETFAAEGDIRKIISKCGQFIHTSENDSLRVYRVRGEGAFINIGGPVFEWESDIIL